MPITVTAPRGVLSASGEREILPRLTEELARVSGMSGHAGFVSMIGGTVHVLEAENVYAGGVNRPVVMVELKLPNIGLGSVQARAEFIAAATETVAAFTAPEHSPADIWVNILNAPDGGWGIAGRAYTGEALVEALSTGGLAGA
jgi:phenylpyruvate tautomerase PptA (4-oxalocrotonate tautomerase family)